MKSGSGPLPRLPGSRLQQRARKQLRDGGVIAYSTESCYGLGCRPLDARAIRRVLAIKARPNHKGLIVIAADFEQIRHLVKPLSAAQRAELARYWPGPYTFLLPASRRVPPALRGRHHKIAVRVTAHGEAAALCRRLGTALVSTSANRAGQQSLKTARACRMAFKDKVLTLPGRIGKRRKPSTIIDLESGRVLR
ncbi:L-threonylcarbamoyladenylate synthase [Chromobacterium violaceum]|uniref:Threonylcarbamoyl-AMP synthase n=3 Tax=Chromobacterium violaceum TaxID=536 RepID=TSAC_CHRVO|nr:L-threonylcarbamoyladenylate synthase [Chromobacterium violaceum]Q7P0L7.1 RecName: Full=Threonylcarbamoyl-AMP synthase; Short=TC-AMP synthase; AltName: Full=L-threonylcarbamoyladenylate synthase; AltName: Full=t(6)A37 threonylcarbamoyladenosine biosynthesis protein TsaC; AltName: Full=tRNA threonylcarbamoyladenosine biosynthesis protein TsaC [Chromobacterium violaceum ATCC 12472]AAQ58226.1 probable Sua5/YciO/YrdC family protein [Chromobacterium violaceum ATCC 12472]MBA8733906.1 L-threonylcarb